MSRKRRTAAATRRPSRRAAGEGDPSPAGPLPATAGSTLASWQRASWVVTTAGTLVVTLGFQTLSPSRRLTAIEGVNARQDSALVAQAAAQAEELRIIRRQVGQLLAGQCAKEKDRMARLLYECGG